MKNNEKVCDVNIEPNKTFEVSCKSIIPMCYDKEDAIDDFKHAIAKDYYEIEVKDVTEESECAL
tara:strand:- start:256 stop:447 length:192 start_codon:yes stop_codon:yes gene_type:complete